MKRIVRQMVPVFAACAVMALSAGCRPGLSRSERALLSGKDSTLYVLVVTEPSDSAVLRTPSVDLPDKVLRSRWFTLLSEKMAATVQAPWEDGVGIAAPQVGLNRRVVCVQRFDREGEPFEVYPNIRIDSLWGPVKSGHEGCLSVPGLRGSVPRYDTVRISYTDPATLGKVRETVQGFTAVIFQHECDHLDGILYTDRADTVFTMSNPTE